MDQRGQTIAYPSGTQMLMYCKVLTLFFVFKCLRDLENSRDNVLFELHKLSDQSHHDKVMLKAYFGDIEMISDLLMKQLRLNLGRTLNIVRKEPTVIVTTLRIIEREEKADEEALKLEKQTGKTTSQNFFHTC